MIGSMDRTTDGLAGVDCTLIDGNRAQRAYDFKPEGSLENFQSDR